MKKLALAVAALVASSAAIQEASAGHRRSGASFSIGNGRFVLNIGSRSRIGRSIRVRPVTPIRVRPIRRSQSYFVKYHMHGTGKQVFTCPIQARKFAQYIESLGLHAKVRGNSRGAIVYFHMHGTKLRRFFNHSSAHSFERKLKRLGLHAKVIHA